MSLHLVMPACRPKGEGGKKTAPAPLRPPSPPLPPHPHLPSSPLPPPPHLRCEHRAGRLLQQLLVPALDGAVTLPQVHHVPVLVRQHLELDVTRVGHSALNVHGAVAKGGLGLAGCLEEVGG